MRRLSYLLSVAACVLCTPASASAGQSSAAPPAAAATPGIDAFERALAAGDYTAAGRVFDDLIAPSLDRPHVLASNPLLNGLAGRFYLRQGWTQIALGYLRHADSPDVPLAQRRAAQLALIEAAIEVGDRPGAAAALRRLEAQSLTAGEMAAASLLDARLAIIDDPRRALPSVTPLLDTRDPAIRFEAALLAGQAHLLLGERDLAAQMADRAWAAAASLPMRASAPPRAALLRAAIAAEAGDQDGLTAMLGLVDADRTTLDYAIVDRLPVCGEAGLRPEDRVTFGAYSGRRRAAMMEPLAASRPAAVAPFVAAMAGFDPLQESGGAGSGMLFTLRCRTAPASDWPSDGGRTDDFAGWLAARSLYLPLGIDKLEDGPALSQRIAEIEQRHGSDDPRLIPLRFHLARLMAYAGREPGSFALVEAGRLFARAHESMRRIGGTDDLLPSAAHAAAEAQVAAAPSHEARMRIARTAAAELLRTAPLDQAFSHAISWMGQDPDLDEATRLTMLRQLAARFPAGGADPRRRALLMRVALLQRAAGNAAAARATARSGGAPADHCSFTDSESTLVSGTIGEDDYPRSALENEFVGATAADFGVDAQGRMTGLRLIVSTPSLVFDEVATRLLSEFRYDPARTGGRAVACRGKVQRVIWRLPPPEDTAPPSFDPPARLRI